MAIIDVKGLKGLEGLKGLDSLSSEDRAVWIEQNKDRFPDPSKVSPRNYKKITDRIYRNDLFRQRFNDESLLKSMSPEERDAYYKESVVEEYISNRFSDDDNYFLIANLTPEGQLDLVLKGYTSNQELEEAYQRGLKSSKDITENKTLKALLRYTDFGKHPMLLGIPQDSLLDTYEEGAESIKDTLLKLRDNILSSTVAEDNKRKRDMVSAESQWLVHKLLLGLDSGELTKEDIDKLFEEIAGGEIGSRYYKAFKDAKELENFTTTDKLKMLANYVAITKKFGNPMDGISNLETEMLDFISDEQNWVDWGLGTIKNIGVGAVAHLMNYRMAVLAMIHAGKGDLDMWLLGKDAQGNELDKWNNPLYWQGVDLFNTFDSNEIKKARANGGISKYLNITKAGEEMEFLSWNTLNEAAKQSKYLLADYTAGRLLGGTGSQISKMLEPLNKSLSKSFSKLSSIGTILATGMANAEAEGLSSFQETLLKSNETIDNLVDLELENAVNTTINSLEGQKELAATEDKLRELYNSPEFKNTYITEEGIKQQALQAYKNSLRELLKPSIEEAHAEDRAYALKNAVLAYINTATVSELKTSLANASFRKVIFNKETRDMLRGNGNKYFGLQDGTVGVEKMSKWAKYGKPIVVNPAGEFVDEFFDSVINNYGQGVGLSSFNNFIKSKYDPASYLSFYDNAFGNFLGGLDASMDAFLSKDAYYEGFIGLLGGAVNVSPNFLGIAEMATSTKDLRELLTILEKISNYLANPILNDIADNIRNEREAQQQVDVINEVLIKHRKDLEDMGQLASTMINWDNATLSLSQLEALDDKNTAIFSTMLVLNSLANSPIGSLSSLYLNAMLTLEGLANGTISELEKSELIDTFLGAKENKSVSNAPNAREIAAERLQHNASKMLKMKADIEEVNAIIDRSPIANRVSDDTRVELAFLKNKSKDWESRLNEITSNLGVLSSGTKSTRIYGSIKNIDDLILAETKHNENLQKELKEVNAAIEVLKDKIKKHKKKTSKEYSKDIILLNSLLSKARTLDENLNRVKSRLGELNTAKDKLGENLFEETLSKEEIMSLHAEDRAYMLDPKNIDNYSTEQQTIIHNLMNELKMKDPSLTELIQDAGELSRRVEDSKVAFAKIVDNPEEANEYFDIIRLYRNKAFYYLTRLKAKRQVAQMLEGKSDDEVKTIAKNLPVITIEDYIEDHPERAELFNQVKEIAQLREDARNIINSLVKDKPTNESLKKSIINITEDAETVELAINNIEDAIDSDAVDEGTKTNLNEVLNKLELLDYQRNATKVKTRLDKKKRLEELAKERQKAEDKKQEAKKVAEVSVELKKETTPTKEEIEEPVTKPSEETLIEKSLEDVDLDSPSLDTQVKEDETLEIINPPKATNLSSNTTTSDVLIGNALYGYNGLDARNKGFLVPRTGAKPDDTMSQFFNWMKAAKIKLLEIIDNELNAILSVNPKILFMMINPAGKATNDDHMQHHVLEVVEYTPKVAKVHNEAYGGVIEANGKKWLIIGTLGFNGDELGNSYRPLLYDLKKRRYKYLQNNSNERFYVDPDYYTEVKSIGAGWIIRKLETDSEVKLRTIQELLDSPERNPRGLKMEDLKWGIQLEGKFATKGVSSRNKIASPIDITSNLGNVFLMVESANGTYIPVAIRPTKYTELRRGQLTDEINTLLMELTSVNHADRLKARKQLAAYLYLKDSENTILIGNDSNATISIKKNGNIIKTFNLKSPDFNSLEYMEAVAQLNPRVNITSSNLSSPVTIKKFDDAGALLTDVAKLGTSNADFTVLNIGIDGKPIKPTTVENETPKRDNSDLVKSRGRLFSYLGKNYRKMYDKYYTELGEEITDPRMIELLHYTRIIKESLLKAVESTEEFDYFIINEDRENPIAVKVNKSNGAITVASKEASIKMINRLAESKKQQNASRIVETSLREDVDLGLEESENLVDDMYEEFAEPKEEIKQELQNVEEVNSELSAEEDINSTGSISLVELLGDSKTDTFADILCSEDYGDTLFSIIEEKQSSGLWDNVPDDINRMAIYLQNKNIPVAGITDVDSWLDMIKNCR